MSPLTTQDTTITYLGDGATTLFPFSFPYLDPSHVVVKVNDVVVSTVFNAPQVISVSPAPTNGQIVEVLRQTPSDPYVTFADGTTILADDMTMAEAQARYIAEEARDLAKDGLRFNDALQAYDASGYRIADVADPVNGTDAMNKRSLNAAILAAAGATLLATYITEITNLADQIHADATAVASAKTAMDADAATAATLATDAAAGPDGETIVNRITAYLGNADWLGGGSAGSSGSVGAHKYWRMFVTAHQSGGDGWANFVELEFRETAGTPQTASGGSTISDPGVITSGSQYNIAAAFDGTKTGDDRAGVNFALDTSGTYWGYEFASAKNIREVAIFASEESGEGIGAFHIDYSDDGSTWTTVYTSPTQGAWASNEERDFTIATAPANPQTVFTTSGTFTPPVGKKLALVQVWGAGGSNNGGGGGYNEALIPLQNLSGPVSVTVGTYASPQSSFGTQVIAGGGSTAQGGTPGGVPMNNGEGLPGQGGIYVGGGPNGGSSVWGGGGARGTASAAGTSANGGHGGNAGTSTQPTTPGGGGDTGQNGARGEVRVTCW